MRYNIEIEIFQNTFYANVNAESWDEAQKKALGDYYATCMSDIKLNWNQNLVFHNKTVEEKFFVEKGEQ